MGKPKRKVLGRGLEALIPRQDKPQIDDESGLFYCPLDRIIPNHQQPRQSFDEQKLNELTESVKSQGIIQPIIVRKQGQGYQIVAGERRWRAAKLAGLTTVPVIIKEVSRSEVLELALIENIQREDLNPLEEAEAYRQLIDEHGLSQEQLAKRVGKQRSSVANVLRLLKLPDEVRRYLLKGKISMGHARAILGLAGENLQISLARKVVKDGLSVRTCEEEIRHSSERHEKPKQRSRQRSYDADQNHLVESLQRRLGTKVDLKPGAKGGRIIVYYYSSEELDRVVTTIHGG